MLTSLGSGDKYLHIINKEGSENFNIECNYKDVHGVFIAPLTVRDYVKRSNQQFIFINLKKGN